MINMLTVKFWQYDMVIVMKEKKSMPTLTLKTWKIPILKKETQ